MARNGDSHVSGFSGKFERDLQSSETPCLTPSATMPRDLQSVKDESFDHSQSESDQRLSEHMSEAEDSDAGGDKMSRRKPTRLKNDTIAATTSGREW